jgi:hypothetical protein
MFDRYVELSIQVEPLREDGYPFSVRGPGGDARGTLRLPTSDPIYQQLAARLATLDTDEDCLTQIGQILFSALFRNNAEIRSVYARTQGTLKPDEGLRLKFEIGESELDVSTLPWEFLYDPDQIGPMATLDTPIVRYLPQSPVLPRMEAQLPLKVLLTGAATEPKSDVNGALAAVREALEQPGNAVEMTVEPHLTRQKFQRLLRESYHVWHFIGHGAPATDTKPGVLLFEDAQGDAEPVSARDLGILLNRNSIRLIVLNACDTGKLAIDPLRSMAPALLKAQIPGVIAMQLRVTQDTALVFSGEFYRALAQGYPLDACVNEGRKAVIGSTGLRSPDWGIPMVYTRVEGGRLLDQPAARTPQVTTANLGQLPGVNITVGSEKPRQPVPQGWDDQQAQQIEQLREIITSKRRRLVQRELQQAIYGATADPAITIEIIDLKREIDKLYRELLSLGA